MIFECIRCQKTFDNKTHYNKHLGRKIQCKEIINKKLDEDVSDELEVMDHFQMIPNGLQMETNGNKNDSIIRCLVCNKIYQNRSGLFKHKKTKHPNYEEDIQIIPNSQKEKSEIEKFKELFLQKQDYYEKQLNALNEKNKQLELLVNTSKSKTKNITNNNTNNNTTNNGTINNINIIQFGREDSSLLNKEEISKILYERGVDGLLASIEVFHFNNRLPQYKNIRLTNLKSKYIDIHNGTKWIKENQDKVLNDTLENHTYHLQTICDDTGNSKRIKNSVKNIINDYSEVNKLDTEDKKLTNNKKTIKNISDKKDDVKLFIYNNSKLEEIKHTEIMDV
jgi:uncharacterized C2H2 Zn-finger protein